MEKLRVSQKAYIKLGNWIQEETEAIKNVLDTRLVEDVVRENTESASVIECVPSDYRKRNLLWEKQKYIFDNSTPVAPLEDPNKIDIGDVIYLLGVNSKDYFSIELTGEYDLSVDEQLEEPYKINFNSPYIKNIYGKKIGHKFKMNQDNVPVELMIVRIEKSYDISKTAASEEQSIQKRKKR